MHTLANSLTEDELRRRAFDLAHFILRDESAASRATEEAIRVIDVALYTQDRRLGYYAKRRRTKVRLGEMQALQVLVYAKSEREERRLEERGVAEDIFLMRYLKHLVLITVKRNSFFVSLGLSRILCNYTTSEAQRINDLVQQNPDGGREEAYYRRKKGNLMREVLNRFGPSLTVERRAHGEERFRCLPEARPYLSWIQECLQVFTPWDTACARIPEKFDPISDVLTWLFPHDGDADREHEVEIRRMHSLLHPDCFEQLLSILLMDHPNERIEVPHFLSDPSDPSDGIPSHTPPGSGQPLTARLTEELMQNLKASLERESQRRRSFRPSALRFVVDGTERAQWRLAKGRPPQVEIRDEDLLIEVFGMRDDGEELLLAAHLLRRGFNDNFEAIDATLTLERGQQIRLSIEPLPKTDDEDPGAIATVKYRQAGLWREWPRQLVHEAHRRVIAFKPKRRSIWKQALAAALATACAYMSWITILLSQNPKLNYISRTAPPGLPDGFDGLPPLPSPRLASPPSAAGHGVISSYAHGTAGESGFLSDPARPAGLLQGPFYLTVRGPRGEDALIQEALIQLRRRLPRHSPISLTESESAGFAIKVTVSRAGKSRVMLQARLIDGNLQVRWPLKPGVTARKYEGPLTDAIAEFAKELARDLK